MSVQSLVSHRQQEEQHVQALVAKHAALSEKLELARKDLSTTDYYLNQLKKQKLVVKEKIEGIRAEGAAG